LDKKIEGGEYIMKETNLKATLPYKSDDDFFNTGNDNMHEKLW